MKKDGRETKLIILVQLYLLENKEFLLQLFDLIKRHILSLYQIEKINFIEMK